MLKTKTTLKIIFACMLSTCISIQSDTLEKLGQALINIELPKLKQQIQQEKRYTSCCVSSIWKNLANNPSFYPQGSDNRSAKITTYISDCKKYASNNTYIPVHRFANTPAILRIATYNIHFWGLIDKSGSIEKTIEKLSKLGVDIICFQEITCPASKKSLQDNGYNQLFFKSIGDNTGVMIAAKTDIKIEFLNSGALPDRKLDKAYVTTKITLNGKKITLCCTHAAHGSEKTRLTQITYLNEKILKPKDGQNLIIGADWNAVQKSDYQYKIKDKWAWNVLQNQHEFVFGEKRNPLLETYTRTQGYKDSFELSGVIPTFTYWAGTSIDRFLIYKPEESNITVKNSYIYFDASSDHLPVITDIQIK